MKEPPFIYFGIETVPFPFIHPYLRAMPLEKRKEILKFYYGTDILKDAYESGVCKLVNGLFQIGLSRSLPSIAGLLFEAFVVRKSMENREFRKELYMWLSNGERKPNDKVIDKIKIFGLGFPNTQKNMPIAYAPQHYNNDIGVLKSSLPFTSRRIIFENNSLTEGNQRVYIANKPNGAPIGAQIKAITTHEKKEIIDPILKGQYTHVLTLLRNKERKHTIEVCRSILDGMVKRQEINLETRIQIERSIKSPESLGLRQEEVDHYYETIQYWYEDGMKNGGIIDDPLGQRVANSMVLL